MCAKKRIFVPILQNTVSKNRLTNSKNHPMEAVLLQPQTRTQFSLIQQLAKALSIPFTLSHTKDSTASSAFLVEVQTASRQAKQIATGKAKGQTLNDLLDELD